MKKKFFSGDSVQQALLQAARFFQVEPEEVAYREVERRHGFLRGRRRAVIEVDLDQPVRTGNEPEPEPEPERDRGESVSAAEPVRPETPATTPFEERPTQKIPVDQLAELVRQDAAARTAAAPPAASSTREPEEAAAAAPPKPAEADPKLTDAARQALASLFELGRLDLEIEHIEMGDERLKVELRGADEEYLLEDRGRLLLALQHLLPRMLRGLIGSSVPCRVDCDDFHEIRTEQLRDLAQRTASEVRNSRRSRTLEPMSPDERRIVHLTLADDPAVETVSQGNGLFKRVQVRPQKLRQRSFDPFGQE